VENIDALAEIVNTRERTGCLGISDPKFLDKSWIYLLQSEFLIAESRAHRRLAKRKREKEEETLGEGKRTTF